MAAPGRGSVLIASPLKLPDMVGRAGGSRDQRRLYSTTNIPPGRQLQQISSARNQIYRLFQKWQNQPQISQPSFPNPATLHSGGVSIHTFSATHHDHRIPIPHTEVAATEPSAIHTPGSCLCRRRCRPHTLPCPPSKVRYLQFSNPTQRPPCPCH